MSDWVLILMGFLAGTGGTMLFFVLLPQKLTVKPPTHKFKIGVEHLMKSEWTVLIISALTDGVITFATALLAVMQATGNGQMPNDAAILTAALGALIATGRTIQQALKANADTSAKLRGEQPPPKLVVVEPQPAEFPKA